MQDCEPDIWIFVGLYRIEEALNTVVCLTGKTIGIVQKTGEQRFSSKSEKLLPVNWQKKRLPKWMILDATKPPAQLLEQLLSHCKTKRILLKTLKHLLARNQRIRPVQIRHRIDPK